MGFLPNLHDITYYFLPLDLLKAWQTNVVYFHNGPFIQA